MIVLADQIGRWKQNANRKKRSKNAERQRNIRLLFIRSKFFYSENFLIYWFEFGWCVRFYSAADQQNLKENPDDKKDEKKPLKTNYRSWVSTVTMSHGLLLKFISNDVNYDGGFNARKLLQNNDTSSAQNSSTTQWWFIQMNFTHTFCWQIF